jgi:hypothetical protein
MEATPNAVHTNGKPGIGYLAGYAWDRGASYGYEMRSEKFRQLLRSVRRFDRPVASTTEQPLKTEVQNGQRPFDARR